MRFEVPAGSALAFSDADGRLLDQPAVTQLSRAVDAPGQPPLVQP